MQPHNGSSSLLFSMELLAGSRDLRSTGKHPGKSVHFLLSGFFCCLGFSGIHIVAVWAGSVLFFAVWAWAWASPKQQKKTRPRPNSKKINTHPPLPSVVFAVWARACFVFCCLGGGRGGGVRVHLFCCLGGAACLFFLLFGQVRVFVIAVWAGWCFFCCLGGERVCFFAVWAGDGSSLDYRSAWLVFKGPNNKANNEKRKEKHTHTEGFRKHPTYMPSQPTKLEDSMCLNIRKPTYICLRKRCCLASNSRTNWYTNPYLTGTHESHRLELHPESDILS